MVCCWWCPIGKTGVCNVRYIGLVGVGLFFVFRMGPVFYLTAEFTCIVSSIWPDRLLELRGINVDLITES